MVDLFLQTVVYWLSGPTTVKEGVLQVLTTLLHFSRLDPGELQRRSVHQNNK